jgi:hypothetical protein
VSSYRPVFSEAAVAFFVSLPKSRQRVLLDRSRELAADPFLRPDFRSTDIEGREICHLLVDDFIFDYWVDHAVRSVMITEIEDAR